jgi:isocitrate dehydrogenase
MTDTTADMFHVKQNSQKTAITVAAGDGIGPEIMAATLRILDAAGAQLEVENIEVGLKLYEKGVTSGIEQSGWDSLRRTRVFLKGPITTPSRAGLKSLNVTVRKTLGLYANVRPCRAMAPWVETKHPKMDLVVVRENEEDLYAGIEHRQTTDVMQCLKLITRPGCERIVRYAFEYARAHQRKKVTCLTKDNIMKMTDGLFHKVFDEVRAKYPEIASEHMIVDIGMARVADTPENFDVIVTPNLYGDILSDITAQISGSVGLAGSANIGEHVAMFEAIHGSAPDLPPDVANPSGLLQAAVMMLVHIGQTEVAERVQNAWMRTIEDRIHTKDIADVLSTKVVGTTEFTDAVIARLGELPKYMHPAKFQQMPKLQYSMGANKVEPKKELVGVDVFLHWRGNPNDLGEWLQRANTERLQLLMITNRGVKVWPNGLPETFCTDHWRCRFMGVKPKQEVRNRDIIELLANVDAQGLDFIKSENLCLFDGEAGFALGQGQ